VASGLPSDSWRFVGFLPRKKGELRRMFASADAGAGTLVAFESPRRVPASLAVLAEVDPEREVAVARELTKLHEEVVRGSASELAERYADAPPRGEVVLVVAPPVAVSGDAAPPSDEAIGAVARLVEAGAKPRVAVGVVAELTGGNANALYRAVAEKRR
jgi:16S rRNA (cytidine1402-2'-O)-methyltransferase